MIVFTCPDCNSKHVSFCDSDCKEDMFICEECSIDFEEIKGKVQFRQDLIAEGCVPQFCD